jgi:phosphoribosylformylglycinamidine synthase
VILGSLWGTPPALDLGAEADLHKLLAELAWKKLISSARDISDGGIAVTLAQGAFAKGIGAIVEQDPSLLAHPLFGLFAEPATTVLITTHPSNVSDIGKLASEHNFLSARIGVTGGNRLELSVDGDSFISAPLAELQTLWASALEANLHGEVFA